MKVVTSRKAKSENSLCSISLNILKRIRTYEKNHFAYIGNNDRREYGIEWMAKKEHEWHKNNYHKPKYPQFSF
ncbi:MAG: hypothetical protein DRJ10_03630 [Bacteroidetes bacterium]|nr:MAG: hypothetical protein DRJ10_03630 [Bacteroidota bacterium]